MVENSELNQFKAGESGNPAGRPVGAKNRSTIARQVLAMAAKYPKGVLDKLKEQYPELEAEMTVEEMMTIIQAHKAITKQDTIAYAALMDSAHGKAQQTVNNNVIVEEKSTIKIDEDTEFEI